MNYKGKEITVLFPSGMYEVRSDKQGRFLKFDELESAKELIDSEIDLFEQIETLPKKVQKALAKLGEDPDYKLIEKVLKQVKRLGYTFEYYLDAVPFNLTRM